MTPVVYDEDVYAERMEKRDKLIRERQQRDRRVMWLTVVICEVVLLVTLKLLEVHIGTVISIACVILLAAVFLDWIEKGKQKRQADERAAKIKKFVERQL